MPRKSATPTVLRRTSSRLVGCPTRHESSDPTTRQRSVRSHLSGAGLELAVRRAVDAFFHFTHRDPHAKVLWCHTEQVWMGSETFFNWALCDAQIDIPWVVAAAPDAPGDADNLREAVQAELKAYWKDRIVSLPFRTRPGWRALP